MSQSSPYVPASQFVEGLQIPAVFSEEIFRTAVNYKPRDDDIFIATYPKCGTTWSEHTLALIFRQGEPMDASWNLFSSSPFLELTGAKAAETMPRPGAMKIHLPFRLAPWSDKAKYICVTRNPKDCCVSYFHHQKNMPIQGFSGDFDEFFELFISGNVDFGDYFDHLLGWYEHRNDPNVLFLTYEEMKENPEEAILKMASFIDDEKYAEPLRNDREKLEKVVKHSSFKQMRETINRRMDDFLAMSSENLMKSEVPEEMKKIFSKLKTTGVAKNKPNPSNFVRKGIIGDWRNYFSEEQSKRMDEKFAERTKDTDIAHFWKKYM